MLCLILFTVCSAPFAVSHLPFARVLHMSRPAQVPNVPHLPQQQVQASVRHDMQPASNFFLQVRLLPVAVSRIPAQAAAVQLPLSHCLRQ